MKKLNIRSPFNMLLGYGNIGYNITIELSKYFDCSVFPIGNNPNFTVKVDQEKIKKLWNILDFDKNSPCLTIWHEFDLIQNHIGIGRMIGMPYWEINKLDDRRIFNMSYCDDLIVSSKWAKEICDSASVSSNIHVIPPGVDVNIFKPHFVKNRMLEKYEFFNIGKLEKRKGHDILHIAFQKAFSDVDDVCLNMMAYNPFISKNEYDNFKKIYKDTLGDKVNFIEHVQTDQELSDIICSFDCGVFPTRSEGFGMPILQSLACGKHVITTNYSAITEFCNDENSILMEVDSFEPAIDGKWFFGNSEWASINIDCLIHCLRQAYSSRLGEDLNFNGLKTVSNFTWEKTGEKIHEMLC